MGRLVVLSAVVALLSGCSGTTATQSDLSPKGTFAQQSRAFTPNANCPAYPGGSGILADGDFSQVSDPGNTLFEYSKGQVFAPSWQVTKGTVDLVGSTYNFQPWNIDGLCSVDLDGITAGGIGHSGFATTPGAAYTVTFILSANGYCPPTVKTIKILADRQFTSMTWDTSNGHDGQHGIFTQETWGFTAAGPISTLKFVSLDPKSSDCGPVVAAISVTKN
jgi:hypothetical protein